MPDQKLAELVATVDFGLDPKLWMPTFEQCFHTVLKYEHYLKKVPDNLALPKYRKIVVRIVYRLFSQVDPSLFKFSKSLQAPDPVILEFMEYLADAEAKRKRELLANNPLTRSRIRSLLELLKNEREL